MNTKTNIALVGLTTLVIGCKTEKQQNAGQKPNIIFIMTDDMGYSDLGCYGQEKIKTPNLDKMADEGVRFTQFYSGSTVCAPSRCVLMTGKHTGHAYIRGNTTEPLRPVDTTIAQVMQNAGYKTGMFGKWGLGEIGSTGDPAIKGWDAFTGYTNQVQAHHYYLDEIDKIVNGKTQKVEIDPEKYNYEIVMEDAMEFIRKNKDTTFFCYLPVRIPHARLIAPDEDMKVYLDDDGNSIFEEVPYEGGEFPPFDKPNAAYAAMITKLDKDIGKLVSYLEEAGIVENTIVFFTCDNGATTANSSENNVFHSNGPLRGKKRDLYEGGIRVPMIAWGPGRIPGGRISDFIWAKWDVASTIADLTGMSFHSGTDGISVKNELLGKEQVYKHDYIYYEYGVPWQLKYIQTVRKDDWKLVKTKRNVLENQYELFNLKNDIGETNNLAKENTEKVKELEKMINQARTESVLDEFNYSYLPDAKPIPLEQLYTIDGEDNGLDATYYAGIDFGKKVKSKIDKKLHFVWNHGAPAGCPVDTFSIRWEGELRVFKSGNYKFYTANDDGARLWVDKQLLINDWKPHGVQINEGEIYLEENQRYPIKLEYFENIGGAEVRLSWIMP